MSTLIYPYKMGSAGSKELAKAVDCKRVYPDRKYRYKEGDLIINWGNSMFPKWGREIPLKNFINMPGNIHMAANKLVAMKSFKNMMLSTPQFAELKENAALLFDSYDRVYCRTKLFGHSGAGIVVATNPEELVDAKLYTAGISGFRDEYRVHVFEDEVIDVQMKRKKTDAETNNLIRNHHNGYVYCRVGVEISEGMEQLAMDAVMALGLNFGAVDIIKMRHSDDMYVLEVNTAPGLTGTTLVNYTKAIKKLEGGL